MEENQELHSYVLAACSAVEYAKQMVDKLAEVSHNGELSGRENKSNIAVAMDIYDLQKQINRTNSVIMHLRRDDLQRLYGPLANRDYLFYT